ncbi:helix-turn-helix domain-containing protein [Streptomyces cacaoi]|uniref:helix-turn-helix domain-containing protein n=1 Tax=Streptomyces cacaoi TaxID=1898 RepID=UPI0011F0DE51|nr:helix-turn-helix domain-containing protein [Streptomyces cacaoi]
MSERPMLNQREAARACGVSRTTIRRRREDGALPGAVLDEARGWLIPVEDLLAAGFRLNAPAPAPGRGESTAGAGAGEGPGQDKAGVAEELRAELAEARQQAAEAEAGRRVAEAEAQAAREVAEARAEHIADLQQALAALMPGPERAAIPAPARAGEHPPAAGPEEAAAAPAPATPAGRRRWFRRR